MWTRHQEVLDKKYKDVYPFRSAKISLEGWASQGGVGQVQRKNVNFTSPGVVQETIIRRGVA